MLLHTGCVSKKQYLIAESGRIEAIGRSNALLEQLVNCQDENENQAARLVNLLRDTIELGRNIRNYQTMLSTNMSEQEKLNALLNEN